MEISASTLLLGTGFCLILLGLAAALIYRNVLRMTIGFTLVDSGVAIIVVALGYVRDGTAPILDDDTDTSAIFVDPINAALAVTAIVIGFAVTAITLAYTVRLYRIHGTLDVDAFRESRG